MNRNLKIILIAVVTFLIHDFLRKEYFYNLYEFLNLVIHQSSVNYFIAYVVVGLPIFISLTFLHTKHKVFESLGLNGNLKNGILAALIGASPMLIGYAFVFEFNNKITIHDVVTGSICAALFEELYYRGFLFGQVFRYTKIGFIPSILFGALLFAFAHLYQSQDVATLIGIFITTFLGAILFAWVYTEWGFNIWVPVFLHLFMNLFWEMFSAGDNALGDMYSNLFRVMTIALVIIGTIVYKRKRGIERSVTRKNIWIKAK
ncbi:MAG: CPBP family intramembrane glutamic endopeptidase [Bacteroidota bacterium]